MTDMKRNKESPLNLRGWSFVFPFSLKSYLNLVFLPFFGEQLGFIRRVGVK